MYIIFTKYQYYNIKAFNLPTTYSYQITQLKVILKKIAILYRHQCVFAT